MKNIFSSIGRDSERDWNFLLACFSILIIVSLALNIFFYLRLIKGEDKTSSISTVSNSPLDHAELESVVSKLGDRQASSSELPASLLTDPSSF